MSLRAGNDSRVYLNGRLLPSRLAVLSVHDRGFLYGDGVFESLRAYDGSIFREKAHIQRLLASASAVSIPLPSSARRWSRILYQVLEANRLRNAFIRITVSRGPASPGLAWKGKAKPTVLVTARPFSGHPQALYRRGVSILLSRRRKPPSTAVSSRIKSLNYLWAVLARAEAEAAGAFEAVLLDTAGRLSEGTTSNLFWVRGGRLYTPATDCDILRGVTRDVVLGLARARGIQSREGHFGPGELLKAEECFLTNTSLEIMPVVRIFGIGRTARRRKVGTGRVGPIARMLRMDYRQRVGSEGR